MKPRALMPPHYISSLSDYFCILESSNSPKAITIYNLKATRQLNAKTCARGLQTPQWKQTKANTACSRKRKGGASLSGSLVRMLSIHCFMNFLLWQCHTCIFWWISPHRLSHLPPLTEHLLLSTSAFHRFVTFGGFFFFFETHLV